MVKAQFHNIPNRFIGGGTCTACKLVLEGNVAMTILSILCFFSVLKGACENVFLMFLAL